MPVSIRDLKSRVSLLALIRPTVVLKRINADNYLGLCPFHAEKTPSFRVHPVSGYYKCFGCGAGGDAIDFICHIHRCSKGDAIRFLRDRYGVTSDRYGATPIPHHASTLAADCHAFWIALRWRMNVLNEATRLLDRSACDQFSDSPLDWDSFRLRSRFERILSYFDAVDSADPALKLAIFRAYSHVR